VVYILYPRRENFQHVLKLDKRLKLVIIDPRIEVEELRTYGNLMVHFNKTLPRSKFLEFLLNADLYIEPCIDEEPHLASIEAALLGVPISKNHTC